MSTYNTSPRFLRRAMDTATATATDPAMAPAMATATAKHLLVLKTNKNRFVTK